jgi:hypothetical protein
MAVANFGFVHGLTISAVTENDCNLRLEKSL